MCNSIHSHGLCLTSYQLNPPPAEPLYVIGTRSILLYLREYQEIEDLGINNEDGTGVIMIFSDAITSHRGGYNKTFVESWLDFET